MKRIHFFELEDQSWFPNVLRNSCTGFLNTSYKLAGVGELFLPKLKHIIELTGEWSIIDLGSGGGGPLPEIVSNLRKREGGYDINLILTDLYPNLDALNWFDNSKFNQFVTYFPESVDAANVNSSLKGIRTMFASFHHMPKNVAESILMDAQRSKQPIVIFEAFGRNIPSFIALLPSILMPFVIMPFVRPFKLTHLFFTYVLPLIPLLVFFDGWVSFLRIYSKNELEQIISSLPKDPKYCWEIGEVGSQRAPCIMGFPIEINQPT